jgi:hypothetical protein
VSNLSATCRDWCQRLRIHAYWIEKERFTVTEINNVEFQLAGAALRREQPSTRWVTKLASGYCGVNKWMFRWKQCNSAECPRCQHPVEDIKHVWLCQGMESPQKWVGALKSVKIELRGLQTNPILTTLIISRLRSWQLSEEPTKFANLQEKYTEVLWHQDAQGWQNFWIGLPSKGWQQIQAFCHQKQDQVG